MTIRLAITYSPPSRWFTIGIRAKCSWFGSYNLGLKILIFRLITIDCLNERTIKEFKNLPCNLWLTGCIHEEECDGSFSVNRFGSTSNALRTSLPNALTMGEKWRLCQSLYDGLEYQTKILLESMCQGEFWKRTKMKDGYYMKTWLIRPSNGNQLRKNLGRTTIVLLKEVPIPLRQT